MLVIILHQRCDVIEHEQGVSNIKIGHVGMPESMVELFFLILLSIITLWLC